MENGIYSSSIVGDATHVWLWRSQIVFIHLQKLARGIEMRFLANIYTYKKQKVNTGLEWFEECSMLKYNSPWCAQSRKRRLKGFTNKHIFSGPLVTCCPISLQLPGWNIHDFFFLKAFAYSSPNRWILVINNEKILNARKMTCNFSFFLL